MEPQYPFVAKHTKYANSALRWFLHHKQTLEHENFDDFCVGRDKFWEGQWSPNMTDWEDFNKQAQVMDQNLVQNCDSPLASDSSSSVSTRESSFFSWNSENSHRAAKHVLQSPELLSSRFSGFSLFNPGINHLEAISKEEDSNGKIKVLDEQQEQFCLQKQDLSHGLVKLKQSGFDFSIECLRPPDSEFQAAEVSKEEISTVTFAQTNTTKDYLDNGWVSDSSDSQSWVSTSSQELTKKDPLEKAIDMPLGRPYIEGKSPISTQVGLRNSSTGFLGTNHNHNTSEACKSRPHVDINADALTHSNFMSSEKMCCAAPHQPCRLIFAPETYKMHSIQDFGPVAHKGHGMQGLHELPEHEENEHKPAKISQYDLQGLHELPEHEDNEHKAAKIPQYESARVDRKAKGQLDKYKHLLPTSPNTIVTTSLQPVDAKKPSSHTKSRYSAAVKERFASSTLHGYLRFAEQGGSPCYSFFVDDSDEVLFARACRQERRSNKENCDWTYSFHSKKDNGKVKSAWKGWPKKESLASDLVANMRVPSVFKAKKNQDGRAKEAHFVLYDGREQQYAESPAIGSEKLQGQPLKVVFDHTAAPQVGHAKQRVKFSCMNSTSSGPNDSAGNNTLRNGSCDLPNVENASGSKESCAERLNTCSNQQAELAAIVISTSVKEKKMTRRKERKTPLTETAGWGVKFLDKSSESGWGLNFMETPSDNPSGLEEMPSCTAPNRGRQLDCIRTQTSGGMCQSNMAEIPDDKDSYISTCPDLAQKPEKRLNNRKNRLKVDVTVILPAGDHGLSTEDEEDVGGRGLSHGPTPLLERWLSGGDCECGGWDMGCGLSVFKAEALTLHKRTENIALTRNDRMNWLSPGNPFKVFTQDYKQKKVLVLEIIDAGLFSLSFQARFSPLQAFSIAVALFHQQMTHK